MNATAPLYLLDTNILVHYVRRDKVQEKIEAQCSLLLTPVVPLISYVTEAEIRSLGIQFGWGAVRMNQLGFVLSLIRRVPISEPGIIDAYVAIDTYSLEQGVEMGKNDLWIAATAHVTGAMLLTTDKDFNHLQGKFLNSVYIPPQT